MSALLRLIGCKVEVAADGVEALASVKAFRPDVVLSELHLRDISGFELARQISALPGAKDVVLLALAGRFNENTEVDALRAGFANLLMKPLLCERIVAVLEPIAERLGRTLASSE
jgi:CheY-like chemotaxis protein